MKSTICQLCLLVLATAFAPSVRADLYSDFVKSLEWLTDSSDVIVIVEITQQDIQKVARTVTVLKAAGGRKLKDCPHSELTRLAAELPGGRRLLIFGRFDRDNAPPRLLNLICLSEAPPPKGMTLKEAQCQAATSPTTDKAKLGICAAVNRQGQLLTRPAQVLDLVKKRIAQGSRLPPDCDRERVAKPYGGDEYGGRWRSGSECDTNEICYSVLAPWEPEDAKELLAELRRVPGKSKVTVARQLANFRTAKTILALRACLEDDFVEEQEEKGARVSVYAVRAAAYQSLRKLGVEIAPPGLRPE
jgi:hypothetical protein